MIPAPESQLKQPYVTARLWADTCLVADGSLFTPGRSIWSLQTLDEVHEHLVAHPDDSARSFRDKFRDQLKDASDESIQLASEIFFVHLLITRNVKSKKKRELVELTLSSMAQPINVPASLVAVMPHGVCRTGISFNTNRWHYLCQIIASARRLKNRSPVDRERILSDPWAFHDVLEQDTFRRADPQRNALLHLLFPDTFEPIVASYHKRRIAEAFRELAEDSSAPIDRQLLQIRRNLARDAAGPVHFYKEPWHSRWAKSARPPKSGRTKRRAEYLQAVFEVLTEVGGQMKRCDIEQATAEHLELSEAEKRLNPKYGRTEFELILVRCVGLAVRAGWMKRRHGAWSLTDEGRLALQAHSNPTELYEEARQKQKLGGTKEKQEPTPYEGRLEDFSGVDKSIFTSESASVNHLVSSIEHGTLGLPDIQRPFVWSNAKVRDLLDSMYRGFPVGYLLQWAADPTTDGKQIGLDPHGSRQPTTLIIDGQQRLTSLYAIMTGARILDKNFRERRIRIAFHPLSATFEVADAAILRDVEWIPDVSILFRNGGGAYHVVESYLSRLRQARTITAEQEQVIAANLERLLQLKSYEFGILKIGATIDEEQVAEIFVRVNSKGQNLKQADFILTLLSIFWKEGRDQLESFSRACQEPPKKGTASPFNHLVAPGPDGLLRVAIATGLRRARLRAAYQILRGKDPNTGEFSPEVREKNLGLLRTAQAQVIDLENWHDVLKCLLLAGFKSSDQLWSGTTILYSYVFFLLGRTEFQVNEKRLRRLVSRFFFFATLTGRYTFRAPETTMEEDLARLRAVSSADGYEELLEEWMAGELTSDFWSVTLPAHLETSSSRGLSAWHAAQCLLGAKALYSDLTVSDLLDPTISGKKKAVEVHHLFPRAWLKRHGFGTVRDINQIANQALVEWRDNLRISDEGPKAYVPGYDKSCYPNEDERLRAYRHHALPERWCEMDYPAFLRERRKKMAAVIREAFERL